MDQCVRVFTAVAVILLATAPQVAGQQGSCNPSGPRRDCGYFGINEGECVANGCCWVPVKAKGRLLAPWNGIPWCFYQEELGSYSVDQLDPTDAGYTGQLRLKDAVMPELGRDLDKLKVTVEYETKERLHVKIGDLAGERYEVPQSLLPRPTTGDAGGPPADLLYDIEFDLSPFGFKVVRKSDQEVLFDTTGLSFVFKDQYLEISSAIPEDAALYGLGESTKSGGLRLERNGRTTTLWARDQASSSTDINLYGSHPILYDVRKGGNTHGVFLLNSNGMDITLSKTTITYKVIGGILDFYFFLGPDPIRVLRQYQEVIGNPFMPPYWSLGFHQCRYGYQNIEEIEMVVDRYNESQIPLEVMWGDIDYMDGYRDFTLEQQKFSLPKMQAFLNKLHSQGQKWVPIVDPGIKIDKGYPAYDNGIAADVFLKDASGNPYIGDVWPGQLHFVDSLHPNATQYWQEQLAEFHDNLVNFDGIWIDMNEPANFCGAPGLKKTLGEVNGCPPIEVSTELERPPYPINNGGNRVPLSDKTVPVSIRAVDGTAYYDFHNLFGLAQSKATYLAVKNIKAKRPFVLSRSTFPGSGKYVAHWSGDNSADWNNLKWGTVSTLNSNLFGIPFAGADICGFNGAPSEELCARWISVGAFYPFARDHSNHEPQELYLWPKVAYAAQNSLKLRYQLLPYLYTQFHRAHTQGGAIAMPLWMKFPGDSKTYDIDTQFMFGDSLMIIPVVEEGATQVTAYFPSGLWYSIWDGTIISYGAGSATLDLPVGQIGVAVHMESIIPMQEYHPTTSAVMGSPIKLLVALCTCSTQLAFGHLFVDSGDDFDADGFGSTKAYLVGVNHRAHGHVEITAVQGVYVGPLKITEVRVLGLRCDGDVHLTDSEGKATFDKENRILHVTGLSATLMMKRKLVSWVCEYPVAIS